MHSSNQSLVIHTSFDKTSDNDLIDTILVTADCQAEWSEVVTKLVNERLETIGIQIKTIKVNRNIHTCFESCLVTIEPMKKQLVWENNL